MHLNNLIARIISFVASAARWTTERAISGLVSGAPLGKTSTVPATDKALIVSIAIRSNHGLYAETRTEVTWDC